MMDTPDSAPQPPLPNDSPPPGRRWIGRLLLGALGLLMGLLLLLGILLGTSFGLDLIRRAVLASSGSFLTGPLQIGGAEGQVLGRMTFSDLVVHDTEGRRAVAMDRFSLAWRPLALIRGRIEVTAIEIDTPTIQAVATATGGLNLAQLVRSGPTPEPKEATSPWSLPRVQLGALRIRKGALTYHADGTSVAEVADLNLTLNGHGEGQSIDAAVSKLTAKIQGGVPIAFSAKSTVRGNRVNVRDLSLDIDEGQVRAGRLELPLEALAQTSGKLTATLPAQTVHRLGGPTELRADVDLTVTATPASNPTLSDDQLSVRVNGTISDGPVDLAATWAPASGHVDVDLQLSDLDPSALWADLPLARLTTTIKASGAPEAQQLNSKVSVDGWIRPPDQEQRLAVEDLRIRADWNKTRAEVTAGGHIDAAQFTALARLRELMSLHPRIEEGWIRAAIPELEDVLGPKTGGQLTLTATVTGPIDGLVAEGELVADALKLSTDTQLSDARITWSLQGLPSAPTGDAEVIAHQLSAAGRTLDALRASVHAETQNQTLRISLPELALTTGKIRWRGDGAEIVRSTNGALSATNIGLRSEAGTLRADVSLSHPDLRKAHLNSDVRLHRLHLARLPRSLLPELEQLEGEIGARIQTEGPIANLKLRVDVSAEKVRLEPDRPKIGVTVAMRARPKRLYGEAHVHGIADAVDLELRSVLPEDLLDQQGWARFAKRPVQTLQLTATNIDLARLADIAGAQESAEGTISTKLQIQQSGRVAELRIDAPRMVLQSKQDRAEVAWQSEVRFTPGQLVAGLHLDGTPLGQGTTTTTITAPRNLFDTARWTQVGPEALRALAVHFQQLDLAALNQLSIVDGLAGTLKLDIDRTDETAPLVAHLRSRGFQAPWVGGTWDSDFHVSAGKATTTTAEVTLDQRTVLNAQVRTPIAFLDLAHLTPKAVRTTPIEGSVSVDRLDVKKLLPPESPMHSQLSGYIIVDGELSGQMAHPNGRVRVDIEDFSLGGQPFETVQVQSQLEDQHLKLDSLIAATEAQSIALSASVAQIDRDPTVTAHVKATDFPLAFLSKAGLVPVGLNGGMSADIELPPAAVPRPTGWLEMKDLRVVFPESALEPLTEGRIRVDLRPENIDAALSARAPGGAVQGEIAVVLPPSKTPNGPTSLEGHLSLNQFPLNVGQRARVDMQVDLGGQIAPTTGTRLNVDIHDGFVTLPNERTRALHPVGTPTEVEFVDRLGDDPKRSTSGPNAPPVPTFVTIQTTEPIDIRGGPVDARLHTKLTYRAATPKENGIRGRIWIPDGTVDIVERTYQIARANITLDGEEPPNPRLDIRLTHEFVDDGLTFIVRVIGTAEKPQVEFSSSPARYSRTELLQIFSGTAPSELGRSDDRSNEDKAAGAALGMLAGQLQSEIGRALPLDTLDVELGDGGFSSLTLGKWLTREIFLAYRFNNTTPADQENDSEAVVQYRFIPGWMVEAVVGLVRQEVDLLWSKRF